MKSAVTISIDVEIMKRIREKHLKVSQIAEEAFRSALINEKTKIIYKEPKLTRLQELNKILAEYKVLYPRKYNLAVDKFLRLHNSRLPNFKQTNDLEELLSLVLEQLKQKKLNFEIENQV